MASYSSAGKVLNGTGYDAHCVIQDAAVRHLPGYSKYSAPTVSLKGPSYSKGTEHHAATTVKRNAGYNNGTYAGERRLGYRALRGAGIDRNESKQIIREADNYFNSINVNTKTKTVKPGNRK